MDSYGELLREARESKNLTLDSISREISIDKRYLEGLENEDTGVFPGDTYLVGFLKNYSQYLELDSDFLLKLYHNKQIQESGVPEGLLVKPRSRMVLPIIISSIAVVILAVAGVFVFLFFRKAPEPEEDLLMADGKRKHKYELTEKKFSSRLYKGDQLFIPMDNGQVILTVKDTIYAFGLETPAGTFYTELAEESEFDINGDGKSDLIVYVSDISPTDESRGAEVSLLLRHGMSSVAQQNGVVESEIPFIDEIQSKHPQHVILEDNRAYPFAINAAFRGSCVFRDKVDFQSAVETYFSSGEVFTANPQNGIRLWMSNSNAVKISITADSKNFDLEIGKAGQVLVEDIKWIKDTDGRYKLVVIELD